MARADLSLAPPPRRLPASMQRHLLFGHPLLLLGSLAVTMASFLIWLLVAAYGIGFSSVVSVWRPHTPIPARVESSQPVELVTGETVQRTSALFAHQGDTWRAVGYGQTPLQQGDATTVTLPDGAPGQAFIQGLQKFALPLRDLVRVAVFVLAPGAIVLLWGLALGWREQRLAVHGKLLSAERRSRWPLPRPLAELYLERYEVALQGAEPRRFTALRADGPNLAPALLSPSSWLGAALLERIFPDPGSGSPFPSVGSARRRRARMVGALLALQGVLVALFLLT